jgi:hypothetical protein
LAATDRNDIPYVDKALRKYGAGAFEYTVIEVIDAPKEKLQECLDDRETYWIKHYESHKPGKGYNQTLGGQYNYVGASEGLRLRLKEIWMNPEFRESMREKHRQVWLNPERRINHQEAMARPEVKARMKASAKVSMTNPEIKARMLATNKATWADETRRKEQSERSRYYSTKAWEENYDSRVRVIRDKTKERCTEEWRKNHSHKMKKVWDNEEAKAKRSAKMKELWADPNYRANIIENRRKARERKLNKDS